MFKLIVLSALFALAAAKPSLLHSAPLIAAPAVTKIVQPAPLLVQSTAHVGSVVSSIPTGISAHSSSVVHGTGAIVTPVVTPVHKTVVAAPIVAAPVYKSYAPALSYHAAPVLSYSHAPLAYNAYHGYNGYNAYNAYNNAWW